MFAFLGAGAAAPVLETPWSTRRRARRWRALPQRYRRPRRRRGGVSLSRSLFRIDGGSAVASRLIASRLACVRRRCAQGHADRRSLLDGPPREAAHCLLGHQRPSASQQRKHTQQISRSDFHRISAPASSQLHASLVARRPRNWRLTLTATQSLWTGCGVLYRRFGL